MLVSFLILTMLSAVGATAVSVLVTPHAQYSSSIGVLGCYINTNRVAYFPGAVNCNDICIKVTSADSRTLHLLRVDSSAGAYDVSYDAWNYLAFGVSAKEQPQLGGGVMMEYEYVPTEECAELLDKGKLSFSAANSMNYLASCIRNDNWVARNYKIRNIFDPRCNYGYDEVCIVDENFQPHCAHAVGSMQHLSGLAVKDIMYGSGKEEAAR